MIPRLYRTFQMLILAALGLFLAQKLITGTLYYYINERFFALVWLGAIGFLSLVVILFRARASAGVHDHAHDHDHDEHEHEGDGKGARWALFLVALPVLLGLLIPASPLGASAISNRGISTNAPLSFDATGMVAGWAMGGVQYQTRGRSDWESVLVHAIRYDIRPDHCGGHELRVLQLSLG
ncbi:MAG TPA: DUF1980 domain-containing protein [Anaerolineales bacterium]|nr:DUF1980 domain-containing protein [Anaerolineales bacterium]